MFFKKKKDEEKPLDLIGAAIDSLLEEKSYIRLIAIEYLKEFDDDRIALAAINRYPHELDSKVKKGLLRLSLRAQNPPVDLMLKDLWDEKTEDSLKQLIIHSFLTVSGYDLENELLRALVDHPDVEVQMNTALVLGRMQCSKAQPILIDFALKSEDYDLRCSCADALGFYESEDVINALIKIISSDDDEWTIANAAVSLGKIGSKDAIIPLLELLKQDRGDIIHRGAITALKNFKDEKLLDPLIKKVEKEADDQSRAEIINVIVEIDHSLSINSEEVFSLLKDKLTSDPSSWVRSNIVQQLQKYSEEKHIPVLLSVLEKDTNLETSTSAAIALAVVSSVKIIPNLLAFFRQASDDELKLALAFAIARIARTNGYELKNEVHKEIYQVVNKAEKNHVYGIDNDKLISLRDYLIKKDTLI
ncbi:MAG: HEAT repeat domain-containing protein [Candidatus Kariarchaeaceae archaeon]